ncbi:MAG: rRNA maturation RNAse YbeY, partial [Phycisphaerae bacterium]
SMETACRQARRRRIPAEQELLRYAVHGTLHLLGYRDDSPDRAAAMHRIEDEVLRESGPRCDAGAKRRKASHPASVSRVLTGRSRGRARAE